MKGCGTFAPRGGQAIAVQADVSMEAQVLNLFKRLNAKLGPRSALVNNAGVVASACRADPVTTKRLRPLFDTHVLGSFWCAREAILHMSTRHGGAGQYVDYAATQGAMDTFTVGLLSEQASYTTGALIDVARGR